jgi:hypothetical protein
MGRSAVGSRCPNGACYVIIEDCTSLVGLRDIQARQFFQLTGSGPDIEAALDVAKEASRAVYYLMPTTTLDESRSFSASALTCNHLAADRFTGSLKRR